jgi:glycine/D-amino acid oxidase-like deaminating enzyme
MKGYQPDNSLFRREYAARIIGGTRMTDRRAFLGTTAAALASACGARSLRDAAPVPISTGPRLAPVTISRDRIIRTVVGLRPYRPSGFVLRAERVDDKLVVHDYGHGGGGVSLSWGTAHLAVDEASQTERREAAVIGCGVVGLATARLLQRRGWDVTIYAKDLPPNTTSNAAGAQWSPFSVFQAGQTSPAFDRQFDRAARLAYRHFQDLLGDYYGVRWISNYILSRRPPGPRQLLPDLYPDARLLNPDEHPFDSPYARHFKTMFIEPPVYLNAVLRDFLLAGGHIRVREFGNLGDVTSLSEPVIMNCTGLGARDLLGDREMIPVKGQLTVLLPQPEVDYVVISDGLYMMPRADGVLLGGTQERGVWTMEPNQTEADRIFAGHQMMFGAMRG